MDWMIYFPNLHIQLENVGKAFYIGDFAITFYGIIIAIGMLLGLGIAYYDAKRTGQNPETYVDLAIIAIITSIIGARLYYVAFRFEHYKDNLLSIFNLRQGGLAIYGGVIAAIITVFVFARVKKLSFPLICDTAGLGLILGQIIGRWGNFFNREVFGGYTDNIFAMQLPVSAVRQSDITPELAEHIINIGGVDFIQVHPTFLYESLWNLGVLIIMLLIREHKKFDGEIFLIYLLGYGVGRFWIEGIRTDQLMLPGINYPVSQALALVMAIVAFVWILYGRRHHKNPPTLGIKNPKRTNE